MPTLWIVDLKGDRPAQSFDFRTLKGPGQPRPEVINEPFPNGVPHFSPDGQTVAVAAGSGNILLADLKAGVMLPPLRPGATRMLTILEFTPDGRRLIVRRGPDPARHTIWDWRTAQRVDEPIPPVASHPDLSPDGRYELRRLA